MALPDPTDRRLTYPGDMLDLPVAKAVMDVLNDSVPFVNCDLALLFSRALFRHNVADNEISSHKQHACTVTL
jgi:hypothetical protein